MNKLSKTWGIWIARGIASIVFAVLMWMRPGASLTALVLVFGAYALAEGLILLGVAAQIEGPRAPYIVRGLLGVAAGAVTFAYPGLTAASLYLLIGVWAIACGATELAVAFALGGGESSVRWLGATGLLSVACGIALLALPLAGVLALVGFIAAYALVAGVAFVTVGIRIHRFARAAA